MTNVTLAQSSTAPSNVEIFDRASALLESTDLQSKVLSSGETMSYREYNKGKPHKIVMLPGYMCNDAWFSVRATFRIFSFHIVRLHISSFACATYYIILYCITHLIDSSSTPRVH